MVIAVKRVYEQAASGDGQRILVDRLWPRGRKKDELRIDEWLRDVAPTDELRKAFHAGRVSWEEFRKRYLGELKAHREELRRLVRASREGTVTLVFGAHDEGRNNAVVLAEYLRRLGAE
jgi:uncharacterized protein YeaO (DUF488 family)